MLSLFIMIALAIVSQTMFSFIAMYAKEGSETYETCCDMVAWMSFGTKRIIDLILLIYIIKFILWAGVFTIIKVFLGFIGIVIIVATVQVIVEGVLDKKEVK